MSLFTTGLEITTELLHPVSVSHHGKRIEKSANDLDSPLINQNVADRQSKETVNQKCFNEIIATDESFCMLGPSSCLKSPERQNEC